MKTCNQCKKDFTGRGNIFCSKLCRTTSRKTRFTKECKICGDNFEVFPYSLKLGQGNFCSLKCKSISQIGVIRVKDNRICFVCDKSFYTKNAEIKKGRGKFCSSICFHKSTLGRPAVNKGVPMSQEQKLKVSESRRGKMTGESNHSWKGGITHENKIIRASVEYRLWREAVFARDNWTCQECNAQGCELNADHIKPFALFPELRLAIDNGRTLCVPCHRKTPTWGNKITSKRALL